MSKTKRRTLSLFICFFVAVFSVTLTNAQRGEPNPETDPEATPGIDWALIQMLAHGFEFFFIWFDVRF